MASSCSVPEAKRKCPSGGGRFRNSWNLPTGITTSSKGNKFGFCRLCNSHFSVVHRLLFFFDVTRHVKGTTHQQMFAALIRGVQMNSNKGRNSFRMQRATKFCLDSSHNTETLSQSALLAGTESNCMASLERFKYLLAPIEHFIDLTVSQN